MSTQRTHVELDCTTCGSTAVHEIVHVGRVLVTVRCSACGAEMPGPSRNLLQSWLGDLLSRLAGKGHVLLTEAREYPQAFARELPGRLMRQPRKLVDEAATVLARREK